MKIKNANLTWKVLRWDTSSHKTRAYDVMPGIAEEVAKRIKKKEIYNKITLKEFLRKEFMYHYWSKSECEMVISGWICDNNIEEKIDMWKQLEINLDTITQYVNTQMQLNY